MITIASDDLQLGHNDDINEEKQIQQYQFESPKDDFELVPDDNQLQADLAPQLQADLALQLQEDQTINKEANETINEDTDQTINKEAMQEEPINKEVNETINKEELTHEENKFLRFLV